LYNLQLYFLHLLHWGLYNPQCILKKICIAGCTTCNVFKKICVVSYITCYCDVMMVITLVLYLKWKYESYIADCTIYNVKNKIWIIVTINEDNFYFLLRLKWKYVRIMEVQKVTMEVREEPVSKPLQLRLLLPLLIPPSKISKDLALLFFRFMKLVSYRNTYSYEVLKYLFLTHSKYYYWFCHQRRAKRKH